MARIHRLALLMGIGLACHAAAVSAQTELRAVFVSVLERSGVPLPGLGRSDFAVSEDGVAREIVEVTSPTFPLQIAVLIDTSQEMQPDISDLRVALRAFVRDIGSAMEGKHQIALIGFGGNPQVLVDYTQSRIRLDAGISRLVTRPGSGSYLMSALIETSRGFRKRDPARRTMVVITAQGPEFSELNFTQVLDYVFESRATVHTFVLNKPGKSPNTPEAQEVEIALSDGATRTGGVQEDLNSAMALTQKLQALALELNNQYQVVYARPKMLIPPKSINVGVKRTGVTVRAKKIL
jgi:VWFA-related protein